MNLSGFPPFWSRFIYFFITRSVEHLLSCGIYYTNYYWSGCQPPTIYLSDPRLELRPAAKRDVSKIYATKKTLTGARQKVF
jgi:hypothetical protein